jgi:beta-mannanase
MMLAFQSEPELTRFHPYGSPAQYVAAFRHIFDVFRFEGVKNVAWIWDVTGDIADHGAAYPSWYPGDHYVDWIMWDPYNWYTCIHKGGTWESFAQKVESMYSWLTSHSGKRGNGDYLSKPWGIGETGTVEGKTAAAKAKWFESSVSAIRSTFPKIRAVIWSDTDDITAGRSCNWSVNSSKDSLAGFKSAGKQSYASPLPSRA